MPIKDDEIEKKVILFKLLIKEKDESIEEALIALADTKMATLDEIKKLYKELEKDGYIANDTLTMMGVVEAKKAQKEFTL